MRVKEIAKLNLLNCIKYYKSCPNNKNTCLNPENAIKPTFKKQLLSKIGSYKTDYKQLYYLYVYTYL